MFKFRRILKFTLLLTSLAVSDSVLAAAYQAYDPGPGGSALANDATTSFNNPAGLIRMKNPQFVFNGKEVFYNSKFTGTSAWRSNTFGTAPTVNGTSSSSINVFVPGFYFAAPINPRFAFGFSIVQPFLSRVNYGSSAQTRYELVSSEITTTDYSPSIGVKLTDQLSFGAGFDLQLTSVSREQIVGIPSVFGPTKDTVLKGTLSNYGYGFHGGLLYQISKATRLGLTYNSQVVSKLSGSTTLEGPLAISPNHILINKHSWTNFVLPPISTFSIFQALSEKLAVAGSILYTEWSRVGVIYIRNVQSSTPGSGITLSQPFNFRNTWKFSIGSAYAITPQWLTNIGVSYDQSATNNIDRGLGVPANGATSLILGGGYKLNKNLSFALNYTHAWFKNAPINLSQVSPPGISTTQGNVRQFSNTIFGQLTWNLV